MRRLFVRSALAVFLGAVAAPIFSQQGTSEIGGRVTDEQGAVLPGVMIVLTNEDTGVFREVTSGEDGRLVVVTKGCKPSAACGCCSRDSRRSTRRMSNRWFSPRSVGTAARKQPSSNFVVSINGCVENHALTRQVFNHTIIP